MGEPLTNTAFTVADRFTTQAQHNQTDRYKDFFQDYRHFDYIDNQGFKKTIAVKPVPEQTYIPEYPAIQEAVGILNTKNENRDTEVLVAPRVLTLRHYLSDNWGEIVEQLYSHSPESVVNPGVLNFQDLTFGKGDKEFREEFLGLGPDGTVFVFNLTGGGRPAVDTEKVHTKYINRNKKIKEELGGKVPVVRFLVNSMSSESNRRVVFTPFKYQ